MATGAAQTILSPEEYISFERGFIPNKDTVKHEYVNGKVVPKSGSNLNHNLIAMNIASELHPQLKSVKCDVLMHQMRISSPLTSSYFYPDILVVCDQPFFQDDEEDILLNPIVIIEILSPSTEAYDRGEKFSHYRQIESLQEYIIVSQNKVNVERFLRKPDEWGYTSFQALNQQVPIASIACELSLENIYKKVTFPE